MLGLVWVLNPKIGIGFFFPQNWMVKINENNGSKPYIKMDDLGGFSHIFGI